jgi:hypothetical protein
MTASAPDPRPASPPPPTNNRPRTAAMSVAGRLFRVLLVTAPFVALGFWLGLGYAERSAAKPLPDHHARVPETSLQVLSDESVTIPGDGASLRVDPRAGERLHLRGGELAEVDMAMTSLSLEAALEAYHRRSLRNGWKYDEKLTSLIGRPEPGAALRAYVRGGMVRLVLVGQILNGDGGLRPVTIFEGALRDG